jgi:putative transposase
VSQNCAFRSTTTVAFRIASTLVGVPRSPRLFNPDGIYHLATQGSDRRPLFLFDRDREVFLDRLSRAVERFQFLCLAYCLMGNHYHLVVQTPDERLSKALRELHGGYSRDFNRRHGCSAHLFRNRFLSREVDSDGYLLTVCQYVVLNPVRAGLCGDPADWRWSSYRATAGIETAPSFLSEDRLREAFGGSANWRDRFRDYVRTNDTTIGVSGDELMLS